MPQLLAYRDAQGKLVAAVGLRQTAVGPLFVEHYLDAPVEEVLARQAVHLAQEVRSSRSVISLRLRRRVARELIVQRHGCSAPRKWIGCYLSPPGSCAMPSFACIWPPIELAVARAERMSAADWNAGMQNPAALDVRKRT